MTDTAIKKIKQILQQTSPILNLILIAALIYYFGVIKGIIFFFLLSKFYHMLMLKVYGMEPFSPGDRMFIWNKEEETYNLMAALVFESLDLEGLKEILIEKGIKNLKKMRCMRAYKFLEWWWKEISVEDVLGKYNPIIVHENQFIFNDKEDVIKYANSEIYKRFDIYNELPYKIIVVKNDQKGYFQNMVFFKFEHSFSDGIGIITLMTLLADNYDLKLFPVSHTKEKRVGNFGIISGLIALLSTIVRLPWILIYIFYRAFISLKSGKTPFKSDKGNSGKPLTAISQLYDFQTFSQISKYLNITFNDFIMSTFSSGIKKFCKEKCSTTPVRLIASTPVANRFYPKSLSDIKITNDSTGFVCELRLIDDPTTQCHIISNEFKQNIRNIPLLRIMKLMINTLYQYFPFYITNLIIKMTSKNVDFNFSNVPGPKDYLIYANSKVLELIPFSTPGFTSVFVGIISYCGKFRLMIIFDEILGLDPEILMNYVNEELKFIREKMNTLDNKTK